MTLETNPFARRILKPGDKAEDGDTVTLRRGSTEVEWWVARGEPWVCPETVNGYYYTAERA